jgi:mono/diheme cytochrome c family protein
MVRVVVLLSLGLAAIVAAEGQGGMKHMRGMRHGEAHASMIRHRYVAQHGLEAQYAGKRRPRPPTAEDLASGAALFARHCASCHGEHGAGDGAAGAGLDPPPANEPSAT